MLRFMRENTGSWIIKIILGLIVVVFIFLGMGSMGSKDRGQVAMVNDMPITMDEYRQSYQNTVEQIRNRFGGNVSEELLNMLNVRKQALDRLIEERLITDEAAKLDIQVSERELQHALVAIDTFKKDGVFDLATYRMVLSRNRLTPETFEAMQLENMRRSKVIDFVLKSVKVSDLEAGEWYRQNNSEVSVDYVKFDTASFSVEIDDAKVADYYEKNKNRYMSEPELTVQYLEYAFEDYKDQTEITKENIALYYNENQGKFTTPEQVEASHILIKVDAKADEAVVESARKEAEEIYNKAVAGGDFAELAKEFSQGPTKDKGGYLGKFARNTMVKPFADKAFSMKPGEISEPVKTRFGWHIIHVISRSDEDKKSLGEVSDEIKDILLNDESKNLAYTAAAHAFDAVIDGDTLEQAGLITTRKIQTAGPFTMKGPDKDLKDGRAFATTAFELPMNEISDVKEIGNAYYIIKPIEKVEPSVLPLEEVKDRVLASLESDLQKEAAEKAAQIFLEAVNDADNMAKIAEEKGFELKTTSLFKKDGNIKELGRQPEIAAAAFKLSEKKRLASEIVKSNDGYYVVYLKEKITPSDDVVNENLDSVKEQLLLDKKSEIYASWMEKLKKESVIEIEPGLIDS
ncbi:PpiD1 [Desulfamplus magnetovallimortis]|uniref:Periplasmic chaperone PpiD n=1 Tax=Desulfamplus magnetovallimortis TaxID=1246637 RepID=A0A1W1H711_9BACT|nr:peptidylprolyl isomerase [Desulfamplus magnetovallimortis]SLM28253.1 PpiD1 [Desulfamplus magnetovallimortis]